MPVLSAVRPPAGSLPWLVLHEVRLTFRSGRRKGFGKWLRIVLMLLFLAMGVGTAIALRDVALAPRPRWLVFGNAALILLLTFMTTQSLMNALRTLFEKSDLDLLLSSPLPRERVLAAKLLGLAASAATTYCLLLLPLALPVAILGHPRLLALVPVLAALAMLAASLGVALAILMVRVIGARGARTVGQIVAAALGGAIYLLSQLGGRGRGGGRLGAVVDWLTAHGWGAVGWSALPARGLFGELGPLALVLAFSALLFAATSWLFRTHFLASVQSAGEHVGTRRRAGARTAAFHHGLLAAVVVKEMRLLLRQPEILFVVLLRLIYLIPLILLGSRHGALSVLAAPSLAAVGVIAAGQLCGSLAWLTISAEDAPDLLAVAPVDAPRLKRMKLAAALAAVAPVAAIVPIVMAWRGAPVAALIAYAGTLVAGAGAGWVELLFGKPAKRSTFRRRQGSLLTSLLGILVSLVVAGATAGAVYLVGT
jgi:ABC-2 type transport system permease protein